MTEAWAAARLEPGAVLRAARFEWRLAWQRRRLRLPAALALLPVAVALVGLLLQRTGVVVVQGSDVLSQIVGTLFLQFLVVLLPLVHGTALVAQEAEARTLVYLLVRPLSRGSLLVGKFLGSWLATGLQLVIALVATAALLLGAEAFSSPGEWAGRIALLGLSLVLGSLAYGALFTLVGLVFSRPAFVGLFLAFGWETAIPFLPGWIRHLTVRYHLASVLPAGLLPPGLLSAIDPPTPLVGLAWMLGGAVVALAGAVLLFARRDYP